MVILLIAVGLAMDASVAAVANGVLIKRVTVAHAAYFGLFFGFFQFAFAWLGYFIGSAVSGAVAGFSGLIAGLILIILGWRMIAGTFAPAKKTSIKRNIFGLKNMTALSVAVSLDALAVGADFAIIGVDILPASLLIGAAAFILPFFGVLLGGGIGGLIQRNGERLGGIILIIIGIKIMFF